MFTILRAASCEDKPGYHYKTREVEGTYSLIVEWLSVYLSIMHSRFSMPLLFV